ncbi:hypothetical protein [Liquorilactobacillus satsumensis]
MTIMQRNGLNFKMEKGMIKMLLKILTAQRYADLSTLPKIKRRSYFSKHVLAPFAEKFKKQHFTINDSWATIL